MKRQPKTTQPKKKFSRILFSRFPFIAIAIIFAFILEFLIIYGLFVLMHLILREIFPAAEGWIQFVFIAVQWIVTAIAAVHHHQSGACFPRQRFPGSSS